MTELAMGAKASCPDGFCGGTQPHYSRPGQPTVTHLVIGPRHRKDKERLVPIGLADAEGDEIRLRLLLSPSSSGWRGPRRSSWRKGWTTATARLKRSRAARRRRQHRGRRLGLPAWESAWAWATGRPSSSAMPSRWAGPKWAAMTASAPSTARSGRWRASSWDPVHHQVTHILLKEGHLWGRKEVAIPGCSAVASLDAAIQLNITKKQVGDLAPTQSRSPVMDGVLGMNKAHRADSRETRRPEQSL